MVISVGWQYYNVYNIFSSPRFEPRTAVYRPLLKVNMHHAIRLYTSINIIEVRKRGAYCIILVGPRGCQNRHHSLLDLPCRLLALCQRILEVNAISTQLYDLIKSGLVSLCLAIQMNTCRRGKREEGEEAVSKHRSKPECGE